MKNILLIVSSALVLSSCVSSKKYADLQAENERLKTQAPAQEARAKEEMALVSDLQNQVEQMSMQLKEMHRRNADFNQLMEAGKMPVPTPEQMRAYELQNAEAMTRNMQPGMADPMAMQVSETQRAVEQSNFENRLVTSSLKAAVKGYSSSQVAFSQIGGSTTMSINANELFALGQSELSDLGKTLLAKISVALEGQAPLYYNINVVTDNSTKTASARASTIYEGLKNQKGKVRLPQYFGASDCASASIGNPMGCDRIDFVFGQDMNAVQELLDQMRR